MFCRGMNRFGAMPIAAAEDKLHLNLIGFELVEGGNQPDMIFGRVFEPGHIQEEGLGQLCFLPILICACSREPGKSDHKIMPRCEYANAPGWHIKKF